MSIQLNIVACPTYPDKFIRDVVVAPFLQLSVIIVPQPVEYALSPSAFITAAMDAICSTTVPVKMRLHRSVWVG